MVWKLADKPTVFGVFQGLTEVRVSGLVCR